VYVTLPMSRDALTWLFNALHDLPRLSISY
jgi:hypothetical protein